MLRFFRRKQEHRDEQEKLSRLEEAETELNALTNRADKAIKYLDDRQRRNHWRESIEQMLHGA